MTTSSAGARPADRLRIGVAVADMSEFVAIDPAYGIGEQKAHAEAALDRLREDGVVPVHDQDIELVFRTFAATDVAGKRALADELADLGVLAVIGARDFTYGSVRLAERHAIPVIDVNAVPTPVHERTAPWLFTLRTAQDLIYLTFVRWAQREGHLTGRRVGVFSDRFTRFSAAVAITELEALGHDVTLHVTSDGLGVGSDRDRDAAERFAAADVDLVLPFVSGSSLVRMLACADELRYAPRILDVETGEHATDVTASLMPPNIYDGTLALVMSRIGEVPAGRPLDPLAERAIADVERLTGRSIERTGRATSGEVSNILIVRDLIALLVAGLHNAGPEATRRSLVDGLEHTADLPTASGGRATFRPGEHWGFREMRCVRWSATAGCWAVQSEYERTPSRPLVRARRLEGDPR